MKEIVLSNPGWLASAAARIWKKQQVWLLSAGILTALFAISVPQGLDSAVFTMRNILQIAPFLLFSILFAAYMGATGADGLIARAFTGAPATMIVLAALAGGLSPFCSCGVIPLIAALLSMGVPLSAVMAFWLASPVIDPSMFILTSGVLGVEFAVAKTLAAVGLGLFGGAIVHFLIKAGGLTNPLRDGIGNGGCGGAKMRSPAPVAWTFWREAARREKFLTEGSKTLLFLSKWLVLAFLLESVMLTYVPAELVTQALGGTGLGPIVTAAFIGVPAYLNGYAALPLVQGLIGQGMAPGAGLTFLVAGGITSFPAAVAVFALVKRPVFALYIALALSGAILSGITYQIWLG
jgi:hypothetical protein